MKRYILIGGNPFTTYTGTTTFTGLSVVGHADTKEEAAQATQAAFDRAAGLMVWIDTQTGEVGEP